MARKLKKSVAPAFVPPPPPEPEVLHVCPYPESLTVYAPDDGGTDRILSDPRSWAAAPRPGWSAVATCFGRKWIEVMEAAQSV